MQITNFPDRIEFENVPGIFRFHFTPVFNVAKYPNVESNICIEHVQFVNGRTWLNGYGTIYTNSMTDEAQKNDAGYLYSNGLTGYFPMNDPAVQDLFEKMSGHYFIIRVVDNNNRVRLLGTIKSPLLFTWKAATGADGNDTAGYLFFFNGSNNVPFPYYGDDVDGSFSNDFSPDFDI